ncbi:uncharacterized protein METZ01_LOCUS55521, partial [marine metagenome]
MTKTLYDKIWDAHVVGQRSDGATILYIDHHLLHEVTSPQAFEGLRLTGRSPWRLGANLATPDHNVPTQNRAAGVDGIEDPIAREQVITLDRNCNDFGIRQFDMTDRRQGIVHVIGPEQGATLPGTTIVCGDSHTSTHGAFGALAQGIGTSEVEHVLATQCLVQTRSQNLRIEVTGRLQQGVYAKDIVLAIIRLLGTAGATGHTIEYTGSAIRSLSMEGRMTVCNMSIEAGARAGLVAVDDVTLGYLEGRPFAPEGELLERAERYWRGLVSDPGAEFDLSFELDADELKPQVSWGTNPELVVDIDGVVPAPDTFDDPEKEEMAVRALKYMGLEPGVPMTELRLDRVFIGSCTNSRIEDLRIAADLLRGRKISSALKSAIVVPGSGLVKAEAEQEGLDQIFSDAGFEWRDPGCSMCLAMNADRLYPEERAASTSNRNFEGR